MLERRKLYVAGRKIGAVRGEGMGDRIEQHLHPAIVEAAQWVAMRLVPYNF